jgi:hypothetical protein
MNSPEYMLMDLAVGGDWPGSPDATTNWALADMKIDYVRAYSLTPTANLAPTIALSNALNPASDPTTFTVPALSPNTATTYTASQLGISGIDPTTSVTVATDANDDLTLTNNSAWGTINDVTITSPINGTVTVNNFVDAQITMGNGDSQIAVNDAMRGAISVGNGDNVISVTAESNAATNNVMTITAGDGADHIGFLGASNTAVAITAGNGGNTITIDGQATATATSGGGNDDFIDKSTGLVAFTGGGGSDVFEFATGAHGTITGYQALLDSIVVFGASSSQAQVATSGGNTFISWGSNSQIELAGVSLTSGQIHLNFA